MTKIAIYKNFGKQLYKSDSTDSASGTTQAFLTMGHIVFVFYALMEGIEIVLDQLIY